MKYAIQAGALRDVIYVGRLDARRQRFADKEIATDMATCAVAEYVQRSFGGSMAATFPGAGFDVTITVTPRAAAAEE